MVKTAWAVACLLAAVVSLSVGGCGGVQARMGKAEVADPAATESPATTGNSVQQSINRMASRKAGPAPRASRPAEGRNASRTQTAPRAASPSAGAPEKSSQKVDPQYRLGPEDVLRITVWESKELTTDAVVRPDGKISFPLIQDVHAEGLTAEELAGIIQRKLVAYVKDPQVSVVVTEVNSPKIYVIGNVAKPGTYPLRGSMTILQALSLAGGFNEFAGRRGIRLVRGVGSKQEVRRINYYDVIGRGGDSNYLLMPGDTIVVP